MNINRWLKIILCGAVIVLLNMNGYCLINFNGAGDGYEGPGKSLVGTNNTIESYIIEGADYYLRAGSDIQALLAMVELQDSRGLDFAAANKLIDSAIANMKNVVAAYDKLIREAELTPYNETVQTALKTFNYDALVYSYGLNRLIFADVKYFLKNGDITGMFKKAHSDFSHILKLLQIARGEMAFYRQPGADVYREINERYSTASLFGSYAARVFSAIK